MAAYTVTMRDILGNTGTASGAVQTTTNAPDTAPPTPNPAQFLVAPGADSDTAISMTAVAGTDANPVEYLFTETTGNPGASSSAWQTSSSYTDSGLQASTLYTYTVTMRDTLGNTGLVSDPASATTNAPPPVSTSSLTLAESIDLSSSATPASNQTFNISVTEGAYQGYKGTANTAGLTVVNVDSAFNNPITAYRFWTSSATAISTTAQGGTIIGDISTADTSLQTQSALRLWNTTDPNGNAFSSAANSSSNVGNLDNGATGTVDITGMSSGSFYIFYGSYRALPSVNITMSGSTTVGDKTIAQLHNGDFANDNEYYMARVDFVNADGFTSLTWGIDSSVAGRSRLAGIVVTSAGGVPSTTPYADWASINSVTGGFGGDDDLDGVTNGQEWYYFNSDPQVPNSHGSALTGATKTGANTFEFSHMRPLVRDDVTEAYEWSAVLDIWHANGASDGTSTVNMVAVGDAGSPYESVTVTATISGGSPAKVFLRQKLTNP